MVIKDYSDILKPVLWQLKIKDYETNETQRFES